MTRYSVEPKDWTFVKGYGFLSFDKNMDKNPEKYVSKSLSGKYNQEFLNHAKKSAIDALKTNSKKWFKEQWKQLVICLVAKLRTQKLCRKTIKLQKPQVIHHTLIQEQLQNYIRKKHLKKDIYLQKENRKLMMIWD